MERRRVLITIGSLALVPGLARIARADEVPDAVREKVIAKVGTNHGHALTIDIADVKAGAPKTYDLSGTAAHGHTVTLDTVDFAALRAGTILRRLSSREGGHAHRLLLRRAPAIDPPESISVCDVQIGGRDDHELVITAADMAAKVDKTYDIQGIAVHTHSVKLGAADFQKLARGEQLSLNTSPGDGHTHVVFIRYPAKGLGPAKSTTRV